MINTPPYSRLIQTKLHKPDLAAQSVDRLRLHEALDPAAQRKLTLVLAPAGYGKTTAVMQWLSSRKASTAWVSLDESDNSPRVFWRYVCSALQALDSSILPDTEYVFYAQELFKTNLHLHILLDKLEALDTDVFLVLDDFHHITDEDILKSLRYLLKYCPARLHLLLISRAEPVMELAQMEVRQTLLRITADDLRFDSREVRQFYQKRGFDLDPNALEAIGAYAEGWAAALVMVAISLDRKLDPAQITALLRREDRSLDQYFLQEVFRYWPQNLQSFLLQTSILDALCAPLCDAVTQTGDSGRMLLELQQGNGFLISLDDNGQWYRYHHIFRDFLRKRLVASGIPAADLHARAAAWYNGHEQPQLAMEHWLAGSQLQEAVALLARQSAAIINSGDCSTALAWVERIPESEWKESLEITALQATACAQAGQFEKGRYWIGRMEAIVAAARYATPEARLYAENSYRLVLANNYILQGNMAQAYAVLKTVTDSDTQRRLVKYMDFNPYDISFFRCASHGLIDVYEKQPELYQNMLGSYRAMMKTEPPGYDELIIGESLYERDRLEEAKPYLLTAVDRAVRAECPGVLVPGMAALAKISRAQGDIQSALGTIAECEGRLRDLHKMHWNYLLKAFEARMNLEAGQPDAARQWMGSCKLHIYQPLFAMGEYELLVYARCLMANDALEDADILLHRLLAYAQGADRRHSQVEILNLLALLADRRGEGGQAARYVRQSLAICMENHYLRSVTDEGEPLLMLAGRLKAEGKAQKQYIHTLLVHALGNAAQEAAKEEPPLPVYQNLTRQEQRVLKLLADGYTNREIADRLSISLSTVKIHLSNIFGKLQVTTRVQCVNEARRLGILPSE